MISQGFIALIPGLSSKNNDENRSAELNAAHLPMRTTHLTVSACRHCQHYATEGRRGGHCKQLGAPVQGAWKACCLALPPFAPTWEAAAGIKEDAATPWLAEVPAAASVAIASCDGITVGEQPYQSTKPVVWKAASPYQRVLL